MFRRSVIRRTSRAAGSSSSCAAIALYDAGSSLLPTRVSRAIRSPLKSSIQPSALAKNRMAVKRGSAPMSNQCRCPRGNAPEPLAHQ